MSTAAVVVFQAPSFPTVDSPPLAPEMLGAALSDLPVARAATPADLSARLAAPGVRVLILPYGSAFPVDAWPGIRRFLGTGGGLVQLGGAPFHQPVRTATLGDGTAEWRLGARQPTYARDLLIGPAEALPHPPGALDTVHVAGTGWTLPFPDALATWALTIRLATRKDTPQDDGSAGPRDGVVRPLVHLVDADGIPRGCALLEIDWLRGDAAGARWLLATCDAPLTSTIVRAMVARSLQGASEIHAVPLRAALSPGESATFRITRRRPAFRESGEALVATVIVHDDEGRIVFSGSAALHGPAQTRTALLSTKLSTELRPGLYHATVELSDGSAQPNTAVTGFWITDAALLARGPSLSVSRDWIRRRRRSRLSGFADPPAPSRSTSDRAGALTGGFGSRGSWSRICDAACAPNSPRSTAPCGTSRCRSNSRGSASHSRVCSAPR